MKGRWKHEQENSYCHRCRGPHRFEFRQTGGSRNIERLQMIESNLQKDLDWCEALIQKNSSSFYRAFRNLSRERAQGVFAIYAFCRIADDAIDVDNNPKAVLDMAEQLEDFARGETPDEPKWRSLHWAFDTFPLEIEPFRDMLKGQLQDSEFQQPKNFKALLDYSYLVAGTVGLMLCPILDH